MIEQGEKEYSQQEVNHLTKIDEIYNQLAKCYHVSLAEILLVRENRVIRQQQLLKAYESETENQSQITLICFTMNIAGPVKAFELAKSGFETGIELLEEALSKKKYFVLYSEKEFEDTGYTAYYVVNEDAISIKNLTIEIEDETAIGRLFDIDVLTLDSTYYLENTTLCKKIGREEIGHKERKCLICKDAAAGCARSRRHTVDELQRKTIEVLLMNQK